MGEGWAKIGKMSEDYCKMMKGTKLKSGINIIFFGDQWDNMWRRRQQLAWQLAKTGIFTRIFYVELPLTLVSFVKFLLGRADREAAVRWKRVLRKRSLLFSPGNNINVVTPVTILPWSPLGILNRIEVLLRVLITMRIIKSILSTVCSSPVVWVSYPLIPVNLVRDIKPKVLWYDYTEDFAGKGIFPKEINELIRANLLWYIDNATVFSTTNRERCKHFSRLRGEIHHIPNGADIELFSNNRSETPFDIKEITEPRIVFVGMLNERLDWDLLREAALSRSDWSFILIGPQIHSLKLERRFNDSPNIHILGVKPYRELPAYLRNCQVGISFYLDDPGNRSGNPQKAFLYLAAGIPVVSTLPIDGIPRELSKAITYTPTCNEFLRAVEIYLLNGALIPWDIMNKVGWDERVSRITGVLTSVLLLGEGT